VSQSLLRGLALVEAVGVEPVTVSELSRRLELDKAVVSRMVHSAEAEGWLVRRAGLISLGPRTASLGQQSGARRFEQLAGDIAHALAGVTGLDVMVHQYAAGRAYLLVHSPGRRPMGGLDIEPQPFPLYATAGGLCLAAQLEDSELHIPDTLPAYTPATPTSVSEVRARIQKIRAGEVAREDGEFRAGMGCLSLPWRHELAVAPTAISCVGLAVDVDAVAAITRRALAAAIEPGANPSSVVAAASTMA
jgi:DNA-binding IclR family transcriptional regulator